MVPYDFAGIRFVKRKVFYLVKKEGNNVSKTHVWLAEKGRQHFFNQPVF